MVHKVDVNRLVVGNRVWDTTPGGKTLKILPIFAGPQNI